MNNYTGKHLREVAEELGKLGYKRIGFWMPLQSEYMMESNDKEFIICLVINKFSQTVVKIIKYKMISGS